jgi:hypothetical protein
MNYSFGTYFHNIWYGDHVICGYYKIVLFIFIWLVIPMWQPRDDGHVIIIDFCACVMTLSLLPKSTFMTSHIDDEKVRAL